MPAAPRTIFIATLALVACVRPAPPTADAHPAAPTADARPHAARATAPPVPALRMIVETRKCMGTECEFKAWHTSDQAVHEAFEHGFAEMDRIEALMTSWRDDSDVARINAAAGKDAVPVSPDTMAVVKKGLWVSELTKGAFDITVGVFKGLWKFDEDNDGSVPDPKEVKKRARLVNYRDVIVDDQNRTVKLRRPGQRMNLEGVAKGYAVDAAVRAIRAAGLTDFIVHAGGDLFAAGRRGDRDWRVGIQDPRAARGDIIFELSLSNQAFNTSGDYERFVIKKGVRYHHILDARTGFPARGMRAVTILAADAFTADALDTAIFAAGPKPGMKIVEDLPDVEAVIVDAANRVHISSGLRNRLVKRGDPTPGL